MWTVYKHTTPNGKIYIGITHQKPKDRWLCGYGYKTNKHFYNAIKRYGWDNITHEIVCNGLTREQAEDLERKLIFEFKSYDKRFGYNKALGGHALSEESRRQIAETRKAKGYTSWTLGKHLLEETKAKIGKANTGKRHTLSEEARQHIAQAKRGELNPNYGKRMSEEQKQRLIALHERPVVQIVNGKEIWYRSAKEAGAVTGIASHNISRVCKGSRATAGGFVWHYST